MDEIVNENGRPTGEAGETFVMYNGRTGRVYGAQGTNLSRSEIGGSDFREKTDDFLWGVAHEALHWVTDVEVDANGDISNEHIGEVWSDLLTCIHGAF